MATTKGKLAIIGSGLIGRGWAMLFTSGGYKVSLFDVESSQLSNAQEDIRQQLEKLEKNGLLRGKLSAKQQYELIDVSTSMKECVTGARHVQECVPENVELKRKVFEQLDELASDEVVLSSSSSAIPCSKFTEHLKHRTQCIISHPVNPPYYMPLVELVPAPWTLPEVLSRTRDLMTDIGQSPVTLKKELPGFVQPRVQFALIQECLKLVLDDVISVEDIDKILTHGIGMRYSFIGPFETAHLNADGFQSYLDRYAEMIYDVASGSGTDMVQMKDNPAMETVFTQLERITPLDKLAEKRKWRDDGIARLSHLRSKMNEKDGQ